ncbi:MAG TPA: CHAT domain-containing protein [Blastocatellia bacterium]|nr:CHAT domain-containing protein [Blastocatellia bacterium]
MTHQNAKCHSTSDGGKQQVIYRNLALFLFSILLPIVIPLRSTGRPINPPWQSTQEATRHSDSAGDEKDVRPLEKGAPVNREISGGQRHVYRLRLSADQFLKAIVEQQGIDVVVQVLGPDGKLVMQVDSESRLRGEENVSLVAEVAGDYRLIVQSNQNKAVAGNYVARIEELRGVTAEDRMLQEARKLSEDFAKLHGAGKYDEAAPLIERALGIREKILGPDHRDVADTLMSLAAVYFNRGVYAQSEPLYQRALAIYEKALGPEHPSVARSLNNLAILYWNKSEYLKAEPLARRAVAIWESALGREHPNVAAALNNLAILYSSRGDNTKAEPLYRRALAIWEGAGSEHHGVALALNNLANIYYYKEEYAKAEPLYWRALAIDEKALGPEHAEVARPLVNLATLYLDKGKYAKAEPLYERALVIREKSLGPEHPQVGLLLGNLANLYRNKGDSAKAEPLYHRARAIFERALGPQHPHLASLLNDLAVLHAAKGAVAMAIELQSQANDIAEYNLTLNLATGSGRQKLAYLAFSTKQTDFTFLLHSQIASDDPQARTLAFTTLLRQKGRGLDVMTDTIAMLRRHAIPQDQELFDQLIEARSQLAELILKESDAAKPETYRARLRPLEERIENLEAKLSARSAEFRAQAQPVTLSAIQTALPADSALVEFLVYAPRDPRTGKSQPPRYFAYLLAAQGAPKWVDLGEAAPIERAVGALRQSLCENLVDVKRLARAMDELVMRPVRSSLQAGPGEIRRLLIAPDGSLNLIPFAALVDEENRYLIERYTISYLTSGRDLLRLRAKQPSKSVPLVVANPLFGRTEPVAMRGDRISGDLPSGGEAGDQGGTHSGPTRIFFRPLPGTKGEALAIKAILPEASLLMRQEATEAALKRARAPRILHIATHGFFLSDQEAPEAPGVLGNDLLRISGLRLSKWAAHVEEPLLRSGLALAGANRGKNGDDDGLLTALEVAGLDLWGTKLVALSACDTGLGEVKNGEGVQGLRRALVLAGSESQVISLWAVSDEWAKDVMAPYYKALRRGEGRSEGLRQAQLRMLRSKYRRHPFYWAAFIQSGEWANLNGRR